MSLTGWDQQSTEQLGVNQGTTAGHKKTQSQRNSHGTAQMAAPASKKTRYLDSIMHPPTSNKTLNENRSGSPHREQANQKATLQRPLLLLNFSSPVKTHKAYPASTKFKTEVRCSPTELQKKNPKLYGLGRNADPKVIKKKCSKDEQVVFEIKDLDLKPGALDPKTLEKKLEGVPTPAPPRIVRKPAVPTIKLSCLRPQEIRIPPTSVSSQGSSALLAS